MTDKIAAIKERFDKLANSPLGMSSPWERKASNGKPLLYGGKRGLLAYGTIATWDEFDLIADVINALPELLNAGKITVPASETEAQRGINDVFPGDVYPIAGILTAMRQRSVNALGAGISRRDHHAIEAAYNELRDALDDLIRRMDIKGQ